MNTRETIVVIHSYEKGTYFFSTDHCQDHGLGETYCPISHGVPSSVYPREGLEDGIVRNKADLKTVFYYDSKEIPNPNQEKQG